ncbi:YitT family protein [Agrobacterium vitis]|uniref:YitT family protein n=2 Tax=Agrobacterium vitis TaxID=373 RepID=A0A6I4G1V5_AGRVI|nr:YitT family protein [Agrobacterium vitis]MUZ74953.1 YitT family protein [Agrobacterium vitis]MVA79310.1 YitT family protein [Agrobacterium vitis]
MVMALMSNLFGIWNDNPARHNRAEDIQGIICGTMISALGLYLIAKIGLVTSGMAGLAFVIHYWTGWSFGLVFFMLNMPFYILSIKRVGWDFTLKTFVAVALTSFLVEIESRFIVIESINPVWGAILAGLLLGFGLLALYRHRASLGGIGILAVFVQDRFGIQAGLVQLAFDVVVMALAFTVVSPWVVGCSIIGAVVLNVFVLINHRSDRYIALR